MPPPIRCFANWKMYLDYQESLALAAELKQFSSALATAVDLAVFPSALALPRVAEILAGTSVAVGAQNIHWVAKGGATGEISAEMFANVGARFALVGHSERRHLFHESNRQTREKIAAALGAGLTPLLCVGETAAERSAEQTLEVVEAQLRAAFAEINWPANRPLIVAYEPVWAISHGTESVAAGGHCSPVAAESVAAIITRLLAGLLPGTTAEILYGGSVRPETAKSYLNMPHISGVLVGAAATKFSIWREIISELMSG